MKPHVASGRLRRYSHGVNASAPSPSILHDAMCTEKLSSTSASSTQTVPPTGSPRRDRSNPQSSPRTSFSSCAGSCVLRSFPPLTSSSTHSSSSSFVFLAWFFAHEIMWSPRERENVDNEDLFNKIMKLKGKEERKELFWFYSWPGISHEIHLNGHSFSSLQTQPHECTIIKQ